MEGEIKGKLMTSPIKYRKSVKLSEFKSCADASTPFIQAGKFDEAFDVFEQMKIGPNTVNPKGRNFVWWLIEAFHNEDRVRNSEDKERYLKFLELLLDRGVELDTQDRYQITALNWAVYFHQVEVCRLLLEKGATPDLQDETGKTPFDYAIELFYAEDDDYFSSAETSSEIIMGEIMTLLLQYGADPNRAYPSPDDIREDENEWLFPDDSDEPYKTPVDKLRREAPDYGFEKNVEEEPRLKIVLNTKRLH